jgi:elongation factor P
MLDVSDLHKGVKIQLEDGQPYLITDFDFSKPGKGQAIYNCKLKNMLTGSTQTKSFRSNDRFEKPELTQQKLRFSYANAGLYVFQNDDFEEINIEESVLGQNKYFLTDDMPIDALFFNNKVIEVELPNLVERKIIACEVGAKGNTASGKVTKPATVEGGYQLAVPLFVNEGDLIRIDTRTGEYNDRIRV